MQAMCHRQRVIVELRVGPPDFIGKFEFSDNRLALRKMPVLALVQFLHRAPASFVQGKS
jgi:hypothetical protein